MNDTLSLDRIFSDALRTYELRRILLVTGSVILRRSRFECAWIAQKDRRYLADHLARAKIKRAICYKTRSTANTVCQPYIDNII